MKNYGVQAVVWQTAVSPVIAMELLGRRVEGQGRAGPGGVRSRSVHGEDAAYEFPWGMKEMTPGIVYGGIT